MDGMNSLDLQERLVANRPAFPIIFITAHDDEPTKLRPSVRPHSVFDYST